MIDEKKLIDEIEEYIEEYSDVDENGYHNLKWCAMMEALDTIKRQPKVGEWIPCSKELPHFSPEKQRSVLVTMEDLDGVRFVTTAKYHEERCEWCNFKDSRYYDFKVVAWQPKPEPWKGKTDE